nr:hypothetical protein CFP56_62593 [Quercus suber]
MAQLPSTQSSSTSTPPNGDQMSFISHVELAAQLLGLVILIITLILIFRRLSTSNTAINAHILPGGNLADSDGVTNSSSQDNIQIIAVNVNSTV